MLLKFLLKILKTKRLKSEDRLLILNALLEKVEALPIKDIITYDLSGTIKINNKTLSVEQAILLRQGAISLENNATRKIITEQVTWEAIKFGVHSSLSIESILFAKAALWLIEQEKAIILKLISSEEVV